MRAEGVTDEDLIRREAAAAGNDSVVKAAPGIILSAATGKAVGAVAGRFGRNVTAPLGNMTV